MTLAQAIIQQNYPAVKQYLAAGGDANQMDEFGFTPLIETAIVNNVGLTKLLIEHGANVNEKDMVGGTALHWAVENNNLEMVALLLENGANPNEYNNNGEPIFVKPILRNQTELKLLLYENNASASFSVDFINVKLLGHRYDLHGSIDVVSPAGDFVEVGFEGFFLEFSLNLVRYSLEEYIKNYAAREAQHIFPIFSLCVDALRVAAKLIQFQQYQTRLNEHHEVIDALLDRELLIIPCNYEGHAIIFILYHNILIRCDRRKIGETVNGINVFKIRKPNAMNKTLIRKLIYERKTQDFIENKLTRLLGLELKTRILITPQVAGNCSWANVVSCVPAIYYLFSGGSDFTSDHGLIDYDHPALVAYREWRDWDRLRALQYFIKEFETTEDKKRRSFIGSLFGAVLFQRFHADDVKNLETARRMLKLLRTPGYNYILKNYLDHYYHTNPTPMGKNLKRLIEVCDSYF